jgi:hypothetical protein
MTDKRGFVWPDMQIPDHDQKAIDSVLSFMQAFKPDEVLIVGDELDAPAPSRWNKGYAGEYAGTLQSDIDVCRGILGDIRAVAGKRTPVHLMRSNHGERIRTYISRYAPALGPLRSLAYAELLGFGPLGITYHERPYEFHPGWVLAHGDEGSLVQTAGGTAMGLAKRWGKSVICGHTHRAGVQHQHLYLNGKASSLLFGIESGHLMDFGNGRNSADYLKAGSANWQQAITVYETHGKTLIPTLIPLFDSRVRWNGKVY